MGFSSRFSRVIFALRRNGMGQYELKALPGFTHTASDEMRAYLPQPMAKKSPSGTSTDGSLSSSQYMRRMEKRQLPVGVIQMCWIAPGPLISATVYVVPAAMSTDGLIFQPFPRFRAAFAPVPSAAVPPLPFSPVGFSGLMESVLAFDSR